MALHRFLLLFPVKYRAHSGALSYLCYVQGRGEALTSAGLKQCLLKSLKTVLYIAQYRLARPLLKSSRVSDVTVDSGSWFHSLIPEGKKECK